MPLAHPTASGDRAPWSPASPGIAYGGDYNPEQWPEETWVEDVALMREAGVDLVSVGIFSWALLEPRAGEYDLDWMGRVLDLLHGAGISVDLGTPTAAPPAWLYRDSPEAWVVDADGRRLGPGSRGAMCPSSPVYGEAAARITRVLAEHFGHHPAVVMWHVHNEYGAPVNACHCEESTRAFRDWLRERYGDLGGLNTAWGTAFWGQRYGQWDEVRTPAATASVVNPAQALDFARFSDDALRRCFTRERDVLREHGGGQPVTTNFMATSCPGVDYWAWSREVDVVSNDHYLTGERRDAHVMLALDADMTRSLAGGRPWLLMEHSTSAVSWQPRNTAKLPGEMTRNSLTHLARGADGILFFQWRAARRGAEKFHSAMLPHGGTATRQWSEVVELGATLGRLGEVRGSRVRAEVALLWDWESFWAQDLPWRPSADLDHRERVEAFYTRLWRDKLAVDFAHPGADLSGYRLVIAPQLYLVTEASAANLRGYVEGGGQLLVSYFSGVVDENDGLHPQGLSGPLGDVLGLQVHEFAPLRADERVQVRSTAGADLPGTSWLLEGDVWSEHLAPAAGTEVVARFEDGPAAGEPALTHRRLGRGSAWYLATRLGTDALATVLAPVYAAADLEPAADLPADLDLVRRSGPDGEFLFCVNNSSEDAVLKADGVDLVTDVALTGEVRVPAGAVRVLRVAP